MKRTLSLLMAVLMLTAVVLTGCSSGGTTSGAASSSDASSASSEAESESSAAEENDLLAQIKEKGTITVAMEGTWAPWTYHDADDNLVGYDVEVAQNIADKEFHGAFRLIFNTGLDAGQTVFHVHAHVLTGEKLDE